MPAGLHGFLAPAQASSHSLSCLTIGLGVELIREVPAGHERLHAHVVARGHPGQIRDGHFVNLV
jgi:hypothetical protein